MKSYLKINGVNYDYCEARKYHTTESHFCKFCDATHRDINDCVYKDAQRTSEMIGIDVEAVMRVNVNCYVMKGMGMGNFMIIRNKDGVIQSFFMHTDLWGQYGDGPHLDHRPLYYSFIEGVVTMYTLESVMDNQNAINNAANDDAAANHVDSYARLYMHDGAAANDSAAANDGDAADVNYSNNYNYINIDIKCPICRTLSKKKDVITIKGLSETCKVCLINEIEKCFPNCGYACVCGMCLDRLPRSI